MKLRKEKACKNSCLARILHAAGHYNLLLPRFAKNNALAAWPVVHQTAIKPTLAKGSRSGVFVQHGTLPHGLWPQVSSKSCFITKSRVTAV
jgi:hypothetical protein